MGVKSPETYGDYYWAMRVEADKVFDESIEDALSPLFSGLLSDIPDIKELPAGTQTLIRTLAEPHSAGLAGFISMTAAEFGAELLKDALAPAMTMLRRFTNKRARETWLTSAQAITLSQRKKIPDTFFYELTAAEGYEDIIADFLHEAQQPYPSIPDIFTYARYHGNPYAPASVVWEHFDVAERDFGLWEWLALQRLSTLQVQQLFRRKIIGESDFDNRLGEIGWSRSDQSFIKELAYEIPTGMILVQGDLQQGVKAEQIITDLVKSSIHPDYAQTYLDGILTKPSSGDIVAYMLRTDPELTGLEAGLRKIGIHPAYANIYKTLAYPIPPTGDLITMAVREAFSPEIAARFGQYEDFPPDFEDWAKRKGLTSDWAKRYWAAHWSLPSATQGFEMLHRGVVNQSELNLLLRALDIMPFWREKLTKIAYRRLTRVDIRRMYKAGVLKVAEVYESYTEHGYNPRDAKRMTDFTVQWALPKHASITRSDILTAYKNRMITRTEADGLLADMGEEYFHRDFMLKAVDYKRALELTDTKIKAIYNLYRGRIYDDNKASEELLKLDLPTDEVESIMEQWYYEKKAEPTKLWTTAQTIGFAKAGLITKDRAVKELQLIGYDTEHINVYAQGIE